MHLEADAVAEAMAEVVRVASRVDDLARHRVHVLVGRARPGGAERLGLCAQHQLVYLERVLAGRAGGQRPGAVRAVAVHDRAHVDHHERVLGDLQVARHCVRTRPVVGRRHDRRERRSLGPGILHEPHKLDRHVPFGAPREAELQQRLVRRGGKLGRGAHRGHLVRVLHRPQLLHEAGRRHQLDVVAGLLGELGVRRDGEMVVVETGAPAQPARQVSEHVASRLNALVLRHLSARLLHVAEVGEEDPLVRGNARTRRSSP